MAQTEGFRERKQIDILFSVSIGDKKHFHNHCPGGSRVSGTTRASRAIVFVLHFALLLIVLPQCAPFGRAVALSQSDADEGLLGSTSSCTIVELYPGYPGYRGNITGLMSQYGGKGDYACLQDLEDLDPRFKQSREDRANRRAADALGIDGDFEDWTWENWLQIEIAQDRIPACYVCLVLDPSARPIRSNHDPDIDDPRLLLGFFGTTTARDRIYIDVTGSLPWNDNPLWDDYVLRAQAYFYRGSSTNAPQLLRAMEDLVENYSQPGGGTYTFGDAYELMIGPGGYVPTSSEVHPEDQVFIIGLTMEAGLASSDPNISNSLRSQFQQHVQDWRIFGDGASLRDYLKENWDLN